MRSNRDHDLRTAMKLLAVLFDSEPKTIQELRTATGLSLRQTYRWVRAAEAAGLVEQVHTWPTSYRLKRQVKVEQA